MPLEIKDRQKFLVFATGAVVALFLMDTFIFTPLTNSWRERSKRISDLRDQIADGTQTLHNQQWIEGHWDQMRTNALPSNVSQAEAKMLEAFEHWERTAGVTRVAIKPQWKQPEDDYMTLECRVDYNGDISRLSRLLYEIENDPMGVKIDSIELASHDDNGRMLTLGLQVSGLMLNPPAQAQPQ